MKIGYKAYVSSMVFFALVGGGLSFFVWFLILNLGLGSAFGLTFSITSVLLSIVLSIGLAVLTGAAILGFFYILPFMKVGSRRQRLDNFLPFTASYMTVLASAGVTPERILRSTSEKDPKFMLSAVPMMLVVMLSIMASIGGNLGGVDVFSFMYLLAFILIPICGVMFLFILDTMQPKG